MSKLDHIEAGRAANELEDQYGHRITACGIVPPGLSPTRTLSMLGDKPVEDGGVKFTALPRVKLHMVYWYLSNASHWRIAEELR
jgi:hypothetical protein